MYSRITLITLVLVLALGTVSAFAGNQGVVNVNTASAEQLQLLPRVGPALAQRIIDFREANGSFASIGELVAVRGIGEVSLSKLAPYIATEGATTLDTKVKLPRTAAGADKATG